VELLKIIQSKQEEKILTKATKITDLEARLHTVFDSANQTAIEYE